MHLELRQMDNIFLKTDPYLFQVFTRLSSSTSLVFQGRTHHKVDHGRVTIHTLEETYGYMELRV